ncbi:DUF4468 domain-containing protein [Mucilaginibacter sp. BJC16-A38]|uniref:DUF4468 domain-containing protein n=1 Tax=Mucilaginibacter phenanthrenivorans TaxID=1234842 RepID=UPI0021588814|nr:DUF4468 domain-containing protein [Mucilaginibacter phenanthrenivorans]MCR8557173.1 DUF4468 domain-containing protein [Mucilaginibacter phenanthrenivorans]
MKKVLIAIVLLITARAASAQKELLPFDEHNKYIYYQVVDQPTLTADTMYNRALYFLKTAYPKLKVKTDKTNESISGAGKFVVTSTMLLKHEDGEISFTYTIESKEHKYRFWLTDFTFTPYKTDRYGKSVPADGIEIPLEKGTTKLTKKQVDNYLDQAGTYSKQFGDRLKQYMVRLSVTPVKETKTKVISTKNW